MLKLESDYGEIKIGPFPEGTRGYDDLRRGCRHEPIGHGLRPAIARPDDLVRMLSALGREADEPRVETMRRVIERERGLGWEC